MASIDGYLKDMLNRGGSDLHLTIGQPAKYRIDGKLVMSSDGRVIDSEYMERLLREICPEKKYQQYTEKYDLDFSYEIEDLARFRTNFFYNYNGQAAVFRLVPTKICTIEELGLPDVLREICTLSGGLVIVTGATGSGKSTTLAAMLDYINMHQAKHIVTLENPVEYIHKNQHSVFIHRDLGDAPNAFYKAMRNITKCDPDIIVMAEMFSPEAVELALEAANAGVLVIGVLYATSSIMAVERLINLFPPEQNGKNRVLLAESLQAVVAQTLCNCRNGGQVVCNEILLRTEELPGIIQSGKINNLKDVIEANSSRGMRMMDSGLLDLLTKGVISGNEAYMKSSDKRNFEDYREDGAPRH